jgi:hypothetical protein
VAASLSATNASALLDQNKFLADHFMDDAEQFADFLSEHYAFNSRISLCFDELEIASDPIANAVLRAPRSIDQRFLVKFSAAPYVGAATALSGANVATQGNDFELLFLSSFSSSDTRDFSEALFGAIAKKHHTQSESSHWRARAPDKGICRWRCRFYRICSTIYAKGRFGEPDSELFCSIVDHTKPWERQGLSVVARLGLFNRRIFS